MIFDEEVLAVLLAVTVVISVLGLALTVFPREGEPFLAIGLLSERGVIGDYPSQVPNGTSLKLHVFVSNHNGRTELLSVRVYLVPYGVLPTNTTPLDVKPVIERRLVLENGGNVTVPVDVKLAVDRTGRYTLVAELWLYEEAWKYTGRWVHLHLNVTEVGWHAG